MAQRYFYSNWLFVPAYNAGAAPMGSWTANTEYVTNAWYHSDGSVPNQQDVGMLVINDLAGGAPETIGTVTGYLGYFTNQLANNNVTMLGYPCNLDRLRAHGGDQRSDLRIGWQQYLHLWVGDA